MPERAAPPGSIWAWPERLRPWGLPALFVTVVLSYAVGSAFALQLIQASGLQGVLFIPAGITVAFLLRLHRRVWWVVLLAAGITEFVMDLSGGLATTQAIGFAAANVVEPLVGAAIVTAACGRIDLARRRHVLWYSFGAVVVATAVGAAVGAGADRLFGGDDWLTTFAQWWLGDALGVVLVGSVILAWGSSPDRRPLLSGWGALLVLGSVALTIAVFTLTDLPIVFSVLIGVVGAGVVFGVRAVAVTALAIALTIAIRLTIEGEPLIIGLSPAGALVLIKLQVGTFTLAGLLIAAESHERDLAVRSATASALDAEAMERELRRENALAIRMQRGLLPDKLLSAPGLDIAARYEAASDVLEVGGDWYDTIELSDGQIGLVVGDIMGHGIDATISMGRLRTALAALAMHNQDPASLLTELDAFVGGPDGTAYATVFYAVVDPNRHRVRYASAGHPPGLLVAPDGSTIWLDQGQTEPLFGGSSVRREASVAFESGWSLVLYSDGLIERRGESLGVGLARLEDLVSRLADKRPDEICDELFERLTEGSARDDDVVVMVMRTAMDPLEYHEVFPANPEELRRIRASLRSWIADRRIPAEVGDALLLSVGEATANSARHAYRGTIGGDVTVRITMVDDVLNVEVRDSGRWKEPMDAEAYPGLGTGIIQSLTEELRVDRGGRGTVVAFRLPLHPDSIDPASRTTP